LDTDHCANPPLSSVVRADVLTSRKGR
jgi:hypothetical protein